MTNNITTTNKVKLNIKNAGGLHDRIKQASPMGDASFEASTRRDRIPLLLDVSGSMNSHVGEYSYQRANPTKIELLRDAIVSFVNSCDFTQTALALEPFPCNSGKEGDDVFGHYGSDRLPLTTFHPILMTSVMSLNADGGTPLHGAMQYALAHYSMTRCIIVSDGEADNPEIALDLAGQFSAAEIPVDCVHIGDSSQGESLLKEIAQRTGGLYIKFDDVASFAKNFHYLTPASRSLLLTGAAAQLIGAKEVK